MYLIFRPDSHFKSCILTDVVVLVSGAELEAKREGGEELEFLGESERPVWTLRPVALPALKAPHPVLTAQIAVVVDHEEDVALHAAVGLRALVVRAINVQIVIDVDRHGVFSMPKPGNTQNTDLNLNLLSTVWVNEK